MAWRSRTSPGGAPPRAGAAAGPAPSAVLSAGVCAGSSGPAPSARGTEVASSASPRRRERLPMAIPSLGGLALAWQPTRDHLRDAVVAHRDPVERVGGVHRALLVRDDDELRALRIAAQQGQEAVDVDVVERGL